MLIIAGVCPWLMGVGGGGCHDDIEPLHLGGLRIMPPFSLVRSNLARTRTRCLYRTRRARICVTQRVFPSHPQVQVFIMEVKASAV